MSDCGGGDSGGGGGDFDFGGGDTGGSCDFSGDVAWSSDTAEAGEEYLDSNGVVRHRIVLKNGSKSNNSKAGLICFGCVFAIILIALLVWFLSR